MNRAPFNRALGSFSETGCISNHGHIHETLYRLPGSYPLHPRPGLTSRQTIHPIPDRPYREAYYDILLD